MQGLLVDWQPCLPWELRPPGRTETPPAPIPQLILPQPVGPVVLPLVSLIQKTTDFQIKPMDLQSKGCIAVENLNEINDQSVEPTNVTDHESDHQREEINRYPGLVTSSTRGHGAPYSGILQSAGSQSQRGPVLLHSQDKLDSQNLDFASTTLTQYQS